MVSLPDETELDAKLRFDIIDTGIGIADGSVEKIFMAFTQGDGSTTRQYGGTGLGLTISKRLAEALGGELSVSSTIGRGSTFSVTIAAGSTVGVRRVDAAVRTADAHVAGKAAGQPDLPLDSCRILLVEDGPDNQRLIGFILKKAGAVVTLADNGQVGWELANAARSEGRPFDVILMDMQMPVMDGYAATSRLREEEHTLPIIALTAHAMADDRRKCIDAGCDEYATKPIARQELIDLVANYAKKTEAVPV